MRLWLGHVSWWNRHTTATDTNRKYHRFQITAAFDWNRRNTIILMLDRRQLKCKTQWPKRPPQLPTFETYFVWSVDWCYAVRIFDCTSNLSLADFYELPLCIIALYGVCMCGGVTADPCSSFHNAEHSNSNKISYEFFQHSMLSRAMPEQTES